MTLFAVISFFCGLMVSTGLGQITVHSSYIWVQGSFNSDKISVTETWNDDLEISIEDSNGRVLAKKTIPYSSEHRYLFVVGMEGNDDIYVDTSLINYVFGYSGRNDIRVTGSGWALVYGGEHVDDIFVTCDNLCYVAGGAGDDMIDARALENYIYGEAGNDLLACANDSDDHVDGGEGHDLIATGAGNDTVFAGPGSDLVWIKPWAGNQFDMGPTESNPLPYSNPPDFFALDVWETYHFGIELTQWFSTQSNFIQDVWHMVEGGYWKQG
jgi:hypothetical protein